MERMAYLMVTIIIGYHLGANRKGQGISGRRRHCAPYVADLTPAALGSLHLKNLGMLNGGPATTSRFRLPDPIRRADHISRAALRR
jgi:hypothetical protein